MQVRIIQKLMQILEQNTYGWSLMQPGRIGDNENMNIDFSFVLNFKETKDLRIYSKYMLQIFIKHFSHYFR